MTCGEHTASIVDEEVLSIISTSYQKAMEMLSENREILDKISEYLYEKETITGKEFMKIFREMKGIPEPEEDKDESKEESIFVEEDTVVGSSVDLVADEDTSKYTSDTSDKNETC